MKSMNTFKKRLQKAYEAKDHQGPIFFLVIIVLSVLLYKTMG
jgi:hypothetical protein